MRLISLTIPLFLTVACIGGDKDGGGDDGMGDDGGSADGGGDDGGDDGGGDDGAGDDTGDGGPATATVSGTVCVELYTDDDGAREQVSFDDVFDGQFPFGMIFVGAYQDEDGDEDADEWFGSTVITAPSTDCDEFEVEVSLDEEGEVLMMGQLDLHKDGILGTWDPRGVNNDEITIVDGDSTEDILITILVDIDDYLGGGSGGSGTGGGSCSVLEGTVDLQETWDGSSAVSAMVYDTSGNGPYYAASASMTSTSGGAEGDWSMWVCTDMAANLVGAHDSNGNSLIDPADSWGAYVSAPDTNANPISVSTSTDQSGLEIQIPLGDGGQEDQGISLVPFVRISGTVAVEDGVFDDLPVGSNVTVAALKYRPNGDIAEGDLEDAAFDYDVWTWAELTGETEKSFSLGVPAETTLYLWAYGDTDGDNVYNESGEYVSSGGTDTDGTLGTGTSSQTAELLLDQASP